MDEPVRLVVGGDELIVREATAVDLPAIVALLADDELGAAREAVGDLGVYREALHEISADPTQLIVVAVLAGEIVGTLQLTIIPGLSRRGARRALIEGVRVAGGRRGGGLGQAFVEWAIAEAARRGCDLVQLTSDKRRRDAHRFYERLGFVATHEGFKLALR